MTLSILIPTTHDRRVMTDKLIAELNRQAAGQVSILTAYDNGEYTVGKKRQMLLEAAQTDYICYFDSDDWPSPDYIESIMAALQHGPDCIGFKGWLTMRRKRWEWIISNALPYVDAQINRETVYLRHTNHLAPVRREISLSVGFPDKRHAEDHAYAVGLRESGLLRSEVFINKFLYHYRK